MQISVATACSLYPLGELWKSDKTGAAFYSLDRMEHCDGLVFGKHSRMMSVREYLAGNKIGERQKHWAWFQKLANKFASNRFPITSWKRPLKRNPDDDLEDESNETLNAAVGIVHDILYNFDALPVAPAGGFSNWADAAAAVEKGISAVDDLSKVLTKAHYTVTDAHPPEQWVRLFEEVLYAPLIELGYVIMPSEEETLRFEEEEEEKKRAKPQRRSSSASSSSPRRRK